MKWSDAKHVSYESSLPKSSFGYQTSKKEKWIRRCCLHWLWLKGHLFGRKPLNCIRDQRQKKEQKMSRVQSCHAALSLFLSRVCLDLTREPQWQHSSDLAAKYGLLERTVESDDAKLGLKKKKSGLMTNAKILRRDCLVQADKKEKKSQTCFDANLNVKVFSNVSLNLLYCILLLHQRSVLTLIFRFFCDRSWQSTKLFFRHYPGAQHNQTVCYL